MGLVPKAGWATAPCSWDTEAAKGELARGHPQYDGGGRVPAAPPSFPAPHPQGDCQRVRESGPGWGPGRHEPEWLRLDPGPNEDFVQRGKMQTGDRRWDLTPRSAPGEVPGPVRQGAVTQGTAGGVLGSWGALVGRDVWERPRGHLGPHPLSAGTQVAPPHSRVSERLRGRCHTQALPVDTSHTDMSRESPGFWAKRCVRLGLRVPGLSRGSRGDVHVC